MGKSNKLFNSEFEPPVDVMAMIAHKYFEIYWLFLKNSCDLSRIDKRENSFFLNIESDAKH